MATKRAEVFTGVARGGLGTGTALDDTQVYDVAELNAPEPTAPEPVAAHPAAAPPIAAQPVSSHPVAHRRSVTGTRNGDAVGTVTATRRPATSSRGTVPGPVWLAGGAAAAVLAFGLLGAAWGSPAPGDVGGAGLDGGSNLPAVIATPSPPPEESGGGKGKGNGHGNGNGNGGGD